MIMEEKRVMKKELPKKHLWKPEEDLILKNYVETHGEGNWATVSQQSGLMRGGKSCRLRWKNYLRPNIKRGGMSNEEQDLIIRMHKLLGNRWSLIAGRLPGRTDNEVKNYWNTHLNKRCQRKEITKNDTKKSETKSRKNRTEDSDPVIIISESHKSNTGDKAEERKEEGDGTTMLLSSSAAEPVVSFNHTVESPIMADQGSLLFFDDEPFTNYMDSFMFPGAFGCPISGDNYAEIGMQ